MIKAPLFKPHTFQEHPLNTRLWATNIFAISTARKSENVTESITTGVFKDKNPSWKDEEGRKKV